MIVVLACICSNYQSTSTDVFAFLLLDRKFYFVALPLLRNLFYIELELGDMFMFLLFILLSNSVSSSWNAVHGNSLEKKDEVPVRATLDSLLDALHRLMVFFSKRYDKVNLDGLFGIRAVQGEFNRALLKGESGEYPIVRDNPEIRNKISQILHIADQTANLALPEVKKKDEQYYKNFKPVIDKPWKMFELFPQKMKNIKEQHLPSDIQQYNGAAVGEDNSFDEESSDECMGTLLGNNGGKKCDVNTCWDMMTRLGTRLYFTTHQILWFQLGMSAGCQVQFEQRVPEVGGIEKVLQKLCYNVIFQMDMLFRDGTVQPQYQDVFLEKGMVCGGMGFMDAVNLTWLEGVMKWQHEKHGCFREIDMDFSEEEEKLILDRFIIEKKQEWKMRKLLEDVEMGDYCSAHKSAVAAGFFAVYTRLFLDPEYTKHQLWPELYKEQSGSIIDNIVFKYIGLVSLFMLFGLYFMGQRRRLKLSRIFCIFSRRKTAI